MSEGITAEDKLACVERELKFRLRVYPRFVAEGRMTQALADRQIELMDAILEDCRAAALKERLI